MKESMEGRGNSLFHSYNKEIVVIGKLSATVAWIGTTHDISIPYFSNPFKTRMNMKEIIAITTAA